MFIGTFLSHSIGNNQKTNWNSGNLKMKHQFLSMETSSLNAEHLFAVQRQLWLASDSVLSRVLGFKMTHSGFNSKAFNFLKCELA